MLICHGNEVYEIDEHCIKCRKLPKNCGVKELLEEQGLNMEEEKNTNKIETNNKK